MEEGEEREEQGTATGALRISLKMKICHKIQKKKTKKRKRKREEKSARAVAVDNHQKWCAMKVKVINGGCIAASDLGNSQGPHVQFKVKAGKKRMDVAFLQATCTRNMNSQFP